MAIRLFGKHRNKTEKKVEMKYNEGMTFIANGYWDEAFAPICEAAKLGHRGATGQLAMMYLPHCRRSRRGRSGGKAEARVRKPNTD